jgi:hypothetical protein
MTALRIAGEWDIELVPFTVKQKKHGLEYEADMGQDRVYIMQGFSKVHVAYWERKGRYVLPLSGMIHPDDLPRIHEKIEDYLNVPKEQRTVPDPLEDSGRNAAEQDEDEQDDEYEDDDE